MDHSHGEQVVSGEDCIWALISGERCEALRDAPAFKDRQGLGRVHAQRGITVPGNDRLGAFEALADLLDVERPADERDAASADVDEVLCGGTAPFDIVHRD